MQKTNFGSSKNCVIIYILFILFLLFIFSFLLPILHITVVLLWVNMNFLIIITINLFLSLQRFVVLQISDSVCCATLTHPASYSKYPVTSYVHPIEDPSLGVISSVSPISPIRLLYSNSFPIFVWFPGYPNKIRRALLICFSKLLIIYIFLLKYTCIHKTRMLPITLF